MLLVILGAGASYDSVASIMLPRGGDLSEFVFEMASLRRIPLANQLFLPVQHFANARMSYPDTAPLFPKLLDGDIEAKLETLRSEQEFSERRVRQFAALRFYLRDVVWTAENRWAGTLPLQLNHISLIDDIEVARAGEDVLIVTFNYDTLIERSLAYDWPINKMSDFVEAHPYKVIKLHGSTSWGRRVSLSEGPRQEVLKNVHPQAFIKVAGDWELMDQYYYVPTSPPDYSTPELYVPAIAVPTIKKSTFECPPEHLIALQERIPEVDRILTIGWRGSELHFLKLLCEGLVKRPNVQAVGGSTADAMHTLQNLQSAGIEFDKAEPYGGGFSDFVKESAVRQLLNWPAKT